MLIKEPPENIVGKLENAGNQHFLIFTHRILPIPKQLKNFSATFILSSAFLFNLDLTKILVNFEVIFPLSRYGCHEISIFHSFTPKHTECYMHKHNIMQY